VDGVGDGGLFGSLEYFSIRSATSPTKRLKRTANLCYLGFGKLVKQKRKARTGFNPKTQQKIKIPAKTVVKFRVAKAVKDRVLGGKEVVRNFSQESRKRLVLPRPIAGSISIPRAEASALVLKTPVKAGCLAADRLGFAVQLCTVRFLKTAQEGDRAFVRGIGLGICSVGCIRQAWDAQWGIFLIELQV
jgi:hypothetical protein